MGRLSQDQAAAQAREYFAGGASCAESVLHVMQESYGLADDVVVGAMGFGGGIGRCQSVCGAITGGVIALSHFAAANAAETGEARTRARELAQALYKDFAARFQHTDCRTLTGYDFSQPGGYDAFRQRDELAGERFCNPFVEHAVRALTKILEQS